MALEQAASNLKSTSLAIASFNEHITPEEALDYSRMEENFQAEQYGKVEGAHDLDENTILMNLTSAKLLYKFS